MIYATFVHCRRCELPLEYIKYKITTIFAHKISLQAIVANIVSLVLQTDGVPTQGLFTKKAESSNSLMFGRTRNVRKSPDRIFKSNKKNRTQDLNQKRRRPVCFHVEGSIKKEEDSIGQNYKKI